jgi:hypothetical protein
MCETLGYNVEYYDGTIIISKEQLSEAQTQFALELSANDFNREENLTVTDENGDLKTLKFSHGKSVIKAGRDFILVDKNLNQIHNFKGSDLCDDVIWDDNDGMIWEAIYFKKRHDAAIERAKEKGYGFYSPSPFLVRPYEIGYYLYDNNGNYMNIEASEISSFKNGAATVTIPRGADSDIVTIDTKGHIVE